ncbi:MAG: hypothetical protein Kow00105_05310 [Phycisphaeraceae bacterium]
MIDLSKSAQPLPAGVQRAVFWLVAATAALIPLESFLISLLAKTGWFPNVVLFALDLSIEGLLYLALLTVVVIRVVITRSWVRTPIDVPLLALLGVVAFSLAVNRASIGPAVVNLRSALRYAAVFYLVMQAGLTRRQVAAVLWIILLGGLIEIFAGLLQWLVGYDLKVWMLPYTTGIEFAGKARRFAIVERGREIGSLFGTLGDTLYYGLFLLVVLGVWLANEKWRRARPWGAGVLLLGIAYSYSRAAVIAAVMTVTTYLAHRFGVRRVVGVCCVALAAGVLVIAGAMIMETHSDVYHHPRQGRRSIIANMTNIFSAEYLERSKRQRLGQLLGVAPTALANAPVLGYSPNQSYAVRQLNDAHPNYLYKMLTKEGFEDVYWVAILCYLGLAGALVVVWLGVRLVWTCVAVVRGSGLRSPDATVRWAGLAALAVVLQAGVLMWFNRVPEIRAFSFYFWLLPSLAYSAWFDARRPLADSSSNGTHDTLPA